jgi:hypothetical protein
MRGGAAEQDPTIVAIRRYQSAPTTPTGEAPEKLEAVRQLEQLLPRPEARGFLMRLLQDQTEYDLARIEVCKVLRAAPEPLLPNGRQR